MNCHYGCFYGKRCMGISREEMLEALANMGNVNIDTLSNEALQTLADSYNDVDVSLGHIKKEEQK